MEFDQLVPYSQETSLVQYNQPEDDFYYRFDLDLRNHSLNMQFQHFHQFYEMFILLDDSAAHIIEGQYYDLQMLDIVCLRPGTLHKTFYPMGDPKKRIVIHFSFDLEHTALSPEYRQLLTIFDSQVPIYRFEAKKQQTLVDILKEILELGQDAGELSRLTTHSQFITFLSGLYRERSRNLYASEARGNAMNDKVYDICAYIHSHYAEPLTLEDLASRFYTSSCHLSRQFPKITGFNVTEYIQRTRIRNAQQSLIFTGEKITDIASACGFTSFSQFNRVFRKICGDSPSGYRKQNSKAQE